MVLTQRQSIGGLGNQMFMVSYLLGKVYNREIPDRYVQDYRYWADFKHHIRDYWRQDLGQPLDRIALHIRRGDYLKAHDFHRNLWDTDYYLKALKEMPKRKVLVFCMDRQSPDQDQKDREWCRRVLPDYLGDNWEMAPIHEDEVDDMNLMASCKWLIGANSSFSWWAAFIGDHDKVIFPSETSWFTDQQIRTKLLPEWETITV